MIRGRRRTVDTMRVALGVRSGVPVGGKFALPEGVRWAAGCFRGLAASGFRGQISFYGGRRQRRGRQRDALLDLPPVPSNRTRSRADLGGRLPVVGRGLQGYSCARRARGGSLARLVSRLQRSLEHSLPLEASHEAVDALQELAHRGAKGGHSQPVGVRDPLFGGRPQSVLRQGVNPVR